VWRLVMPVMTCCSYLSHCRDCQEHARTWVNREVQGWERGAPQRGAVRPRRGTPS
jgi:hypothetical protein